jgi:queuine tRNA-ribosyltransferase
MGVGTPVNLLECIGRGIDMFDCVMPSRNARHGMLFTRNGIINIKNLKWAQDFSSIDEHGNSYVDSFYSKAYLRHLMISKENLGIQIATLHNLTFYLSLMTEAREHILNGTFKKWKENMIPILARKL